MLDDPPVADRPVFNFAIAISPILQPDEFTEGNARPQFRQCERSEELSRLEFRIRENDTRISNEVNTRTYTHTRAHTHIHARADDVHSRALTCTRLQCPGKRSILEGCCPIEKDSRAPAAAFAARRRSESSYESSREKVNPSRVATRFRGSASKSSRSAEMARRALRARGENFQSTAALCASAEIPSILFPRSHFSWAMSEMGFASKRRRRLRDKGISISGRQQTNSLPL